MTFKNVQLQNYTIYSTDHIIHQITMSLQLNIVATHHALNVIGLLIIQPNHTQNLAKLYWGGGTQVGPILIQVFAKMGPTIIHEQNLP